MTAEEARARIEDETQWQSAPALTIGEVDRLTERAVVAGGDEIAVSSQIAAGWRMKAGKAKYDIKTGTTHAERSQLAEIGLRMAAIHDAAGESGIVSLDLNFLAG